MIRFKLPAKPKKERKQEPKKYAKVVSMLRDYGRERNLPSKDVVALHKEMYR